MPLTFFLNEIQASSPTLGRGKWGDAKALDTIKESGAFYICDGIRVTIFKVVLLYGDHFIGTHAGRMHYLFLYAVFKEDII
jgi:hypothetical protein